MLRIKDLHTANWTSIAFFSSTSCPLNQSHPSHLYLNPPPPFLTPTPHHHHHHHRHNDGIHSLDVVCDLSTLFLFFVPHIPNPSYAVAALLHYNLLFQPVAATTSSLPQQPSSSPLDSATTAIPRQRGLHSQSLAVLHWKQYAVTLAVLSSSFSSFCLSLSPLLSHTSPGTSRFLRTTPIKEGSKRRRLP